VIRTPLLAAALVLVGCSKNIDTTDAVRLGVMDYMNTVAPRIGLDLSNMQVDVTAVSFEKEHAHATVAITPKSTGQGRMELAYDLDRKGDKWVVHGNAMSAGSAHGGQDSSGATQGHAPAQTAPNGSQPDADQLPAGHPAVGTKP
jgi:hypothetical protein